MPVENSSRALPGVDADAAARVLAVGDEQVGTLALGKRLGAQLQGQPAGLADDVAEEE